jgi:hypothetical protein
MPGKTLPTGKPEMLSSPMAGRPNPLTGVKEGYIIDVATEKQ